MTSVEVRLQPICFDLDGTLADSAEGIIFSLNHALAACGIDATHVEWRRIVGPPLQRMIAAALPEVDDRQVANVVTTFRTHYARTGLFQSGVFPGVPEMLETLMDGGYPMYVITNKPQAQAEAVIQHLGLAGCFRRIVGGDPAGRVPKAERAAELMKQEDLLGATFVGDGIDDLLAAERMGADFVLAAWGYGVTGVLEARPEVHRLRRPSQLPAFIRTASRNT